MIGSKNTKVNINFRNLAPRLLAGWSTLLLVSGVILSGTKTVAHEMDAARVTHVGVSRAQATFTRHNDLSHMPAALAVHSPAVIVGSAVGGELTVRTGLIVHTARVHHVMNARADHATIAVHNPVVEHLLNDHHPLALHAANASHVTQHVARRLLSIAADDVPNSYVMDTSYVRSATGIDIFGAPKDWPALAAKYGYYLSDKPVPGGVICFDGGAYGTSAAYGFVGVVVYYQDRGGHWQIDTRYAYPAEGRSYYDNSYVKEQEFHVAKNDPHAHYIYRAAASKGPSGYYTRPDYAGHNIVGEEHTFTGEAKDVVAIYPESGYVRAYVKPGQVVRVLARAEVGETLWVFVETPYRAGVVYAVMHAGSSARLVKYDASLPEAAQMYYAKNYGDTVLDLGYADYSRIAGDSGEVTITVKKGYDPAHLQLLQTVRLQLARN